MVSDVYKIRFCRLREQMKNNYEVDVNHRREYVKTFSNGGSELDQRSHPTFL